MRFNSKPFLRISAVLLVLVIIYFLMVNFQKESEKGHESINIHFKNSNSEDINLQLSIDDIKDDVISKFSKNRILFKESIENFNNKHYDIVHVNYEYVIEYILAFYNNKLVSIDGSDSINGRWRILPVEKD